ncbi:Dps family protein [Croceimicrobium hydrocarbonivorans]|uniref:DNA starvation/stationary phase protection protein n=1 Tax=Croceimicrobium hydrocarbonivorans TaxID=2761580 RepID=A0A7H0VC23_9FLAO|nr:Dps family protein [Croceimicrobium hydrocarbonivorans]QNR23271.1 DNA starvation/stationary phase protection protein [Croceimicrobium hydrocarbonivorans]|tara:strand:- start:18 stop:488 length:471 start_codon:yes stop_codon:yes gene_type:complete
MSNNQIGLPINEASKLADKLNILLANYQLFYANSRALHWNIKGEKFFELHVKFEELYMDSFQKVDEIAERILTLGYTPLHTFTDYLKEAKIAEAANISEARPAVEAVLSGYKTLLELEREILDLSGEMNDEGTNALMSDYIREQEKSVWMYSAFLK